MKFDELVEKLLESTSPLRTLYHNTPLYNIAEIIKSDSFQCGDNQDDLKYRLTKPFNKYPYYMSAARTPNNRYARKGAEWGSAVSLELDIAKLSDRRFIVIRPFNYFEYTNARESEDRILSMEGTIDNFNQYIKAFHVFIHPTDVKNINAGNDLANMDKYTFNYAIKTILNTNKPAYAYNTQNEFHSMNRVKREPLSEKHLIP